jgi:coniferyl-aldehyde dehydrogenase
MASASEHLVPVLLELGGKSPVILHPSFPMKDAAERIAFGKCFNAGQTCVAPDYLLCPKGLRDEFVKAFTAQVSKMYPKMLHNPDYTSVVDERQYRRAQDLIEDACAQGAKIVEINPAGERFEDTHKMPVTLVLDVTPKMRIMQEEIFAPILAIMEVGSVDEAIQFANSMPRPLALYYFDFDRSRAQDVALRTHSGGMCINDVMSHVSADDLPFGGLGASGMGRYHSREGFLTMSNMKPVLSKPRFYNMRHVMAPFEKSPMKKVLRFILK